MAPGHRLTRILWGTTKGVARALGYGLVGGFVVLLILFVRHLEGRPDLKVWHKSELSADFTAGSSVENFEEYFAIEDRLFAQLDEEVYDQIELEDRRRINRYHRGSLSDPGRWPTNWNRTFELATEDPKVGVLLVHGMSDSPYSMKSLGERLHSEGAWVVGLRVPGHGTAPSGLLDVRWQDMAAAVELAMNHLHSSVGQQPLFIVGYSNGGALAVHYALTSLEKDSLPTAQGLVLLSPEIGLTKIAALAIWQERLGHLLGLRKLAWNSILPEYDPYKYNSFTVNAAVQARLLTVEIQGQISRYESSGELTRLPPILAFQSVVDATVTAPALVEGLFQRLPARGHEMVLFDINRTAEIEHILKGNPTAWIDSMLRDTITAFRVTALTNENEESERVVSRSRKAGESVVTTCPTDLVWPRGLFSLAHVALPFPPDDPLYGGPDAGESPGIQLGDVALRGEHGVLQIGPAAMLRLRWNPFHSYLEQRTLEFTGLSPLAQGACGH